MPVSVAIQHLNIIRLNLSLERASLVVLVVQNPPANAGNMGVAGSIPGWGRSPGGGHGNSLQDSYLENPMDRGAWRASVHGVAKSQTWVKWQHCTVSFYKRKTNCYHVWRSGGTALIMEYHLSSTKHSIERHLAGKMSFGRGMDK